MRKAILLTLIVAGPLRADIVDVRQGTNLALAVNADGTTIVVDLLGGLWRLPATGGGATMLLPPGSGFAQPRFSPDGATIVAERRAGSQTDIWLLNLNSGALRQLTDTAADERQPEFLADGGGIVFAGDRGGRQQLWTLDLATSALRQLTDEPGENRFPSVSPTGAIAYVNSYLGRDSIRVLDRGPAGTALSESGDRLDAPAWRPGPAGPVIVFNERNASRSDLAMVIDADVTIERQLTRDEDVFVGRVGWIGPGEFVYAADGQLWRRAVVSTERRPIHLFAAVSVEGQPPAPQPLLAIEPNERPVAGIRDQRAAADGTGVVFAALGDIWLQTRRELLQLTDDMAVDVEPVELPGTGRVAFLSDRDGKFDVWSVATATRELTRLTRSDEQSGSLHASRDGVYVYYTSAPVAGGTARVVRLRADGSGGAETLAGPYAGPVDLSVDDGSLYLRRGGDRTRIADGVIGAAAPQADPGEFSPAATLTWDEARGEPLVIMAGRLFDGIRNEYRRHVDIHTDGNTITAIVGRGRLPVIGRLLDYSDQTVIPGMIDVHAHHPRNTDQSVGVAWLLAGVTTVREIGGDVAAATERAESWASGRRPGPRLVVAAASPATAALVSAGFRHALEPAPLQAPAADVPLIPEMPLSPLSRTYQDTLAVLAGSGGYLSTGLAAALSMPGRRDTRPALAGSLISIIERTQRSIGRVAVGSDAPAVPYGRGFTSEIETLVAGGIPAAEVLRWATAGGAIALGLDRQLGSAEPGKLADLVVVRGDPLAHIADLHNIELVLKRGRVVSGAAAD